MRSKCISHYVYYSNDDEFGNAVKAAFTPTLDSLYRTCPNTQLKAHGTAVGLPTDEDMGNSEVGHNALGCGQIYAQGAKLVNESIHYGKMYSSKTWNALISKVNGILIITADHGNADEMYEKSKENSFPRAKTSYAQPGTFYYL